MYQFYYSNKTELIESSYSKNVHDMFEIDAIRPAMWEEHCLECSAPACFNNCVHYIPRLDGRCKRFENGIFVQNNELGCGGQSARIKFRKWANMMTVLFPAMVTEEDYQKLINSNQRLGNRIGSIVESSLPSKLKFNLIRVPEYIRRNKLRKLTGIENEPSAFVFHGYSFYTEAYRLIIEVFNEHVSVYKNSIVINPGENLVIIDADGLNSACWRNNNLVKIYPENDIEAELEILWCDFIRGKKKNTDLPADNVKCLIWDLDNTLWNGILIESDSTDELVLREGVLDVIKELDRRGIIQSIASKNDYETAWPVIEEFGLSEYFLYPQIHWNAKSSSIEQIAKCLNIGVDSIAFIDDSSFERNQVISVLPQVRTYDAKEVTSILYKEEFITPVTTVSRNRREMYRAEEKRNQLMEESNDDTIEFLKKCHLRMYIFTPNTQEEKERCYELVVRTNQLNMSGIKYTQDEFDKVWTKVNHTNFAFSCEDDYGKYGIVGYGQYKVDANKLIFTEFAMSCRVAGKYIESALFEELLLMTNCSYGIMNVNKTKKNVLLRKNLENAGFVKANETDNEVEYQFKFGLINSNLITTLRGENAG